jgi:hypothetical protein
MVPKTKAAIAIIQTQVSSGHGSVKGSLVSVPQGESVCANAITGSNKITAKKARAISLLVYLRIIFLHMNSIPAIIN